MTSEDWADRETAAATTTPERVTEQVMLRRLRARYGGRSGNGYRWVFATHVRSHAGFDATRTADAVALDLWPSKGLELHGFEIKISRADWLRELREPDKHGAVGRYCDRWWLVVPDRTIVHSCELPAGWGLIECREPGLVTGDGQLARIRRVDAARAATRAIRPAPRRVAEPIPRTFMAALLRATMQTALLDAGADW